MEQNVELILGSSSPMNPPPAKRPRSSDNSLEAEGLSNIPLMEKKPLRDLFFEDGNIVFATNSYVFKLHRGVLSMNSTLFSSMFRLPQPLAEDEETYDGLPVVRLVGDDEAAVVFLLRSLYNRNFYRKDQKTTFPIVTHLLRISTKYVVDVIRREVIAQLSLVYPSTFEDYICMDGMKIARQLFPIKAGYPFKILCLARETSANILLPSLFYSCSLYTVDAIMAFSESGVSESRWEAEDRSLCLAGRQKLMFDIRDKVFHFLDTQAPVNCMSKGLCKSQMHMCYVMNYKPLMSNPIILRQGYVDFLLTKVWGADKAICEVCRDAIKQCINEGRKELWNNLPGYFGLPKWEKLKETT